ncbi:MAG: glycosyltransferase [Catenibacterium mitsuokai]|nr:glycosyltransferase [Catenibacterium mitsuokai]MEE0335032.1 glycosyltransferase [Catenibacterium mitsuokai]
MDLISVIVPVYQVENYLNQCIESIIEQTYTNLEIILIDDGSKDNCPQICDDWSIKDKRIKVIHKKNGGLSDARNVGLDIAKGKYIAFIDSDDWVDSRYIELLYNSLIKSEADISACSIQKVYDADSVDPYNLNPKLQLVTPKEAIKDILYDRRFKTVAWNKLYSKEILSGERFIVGRIHEDEFFSYKVFDKAQKLVFVDASLYKYRQRSGSIMSSPSLKHLDLLDAYLNRIKFLENNYTDLASKDKLNFCIVCINFYKDFLKSDSDFKKIALNRIKNYRRKVKFNIKEFNVLSWKEKIYVIFSKSMIIDYYCRIVMLRRQ